jgi:hypothetical protein
MDALPPTEIALAWLVDVTMPELAGKEKRRRLARTARHFGRARDHLWDLPAHRPWAAICIVRHARPCAGHPRFSSRNVRKQGVDGRDKPGHDGQQF